MVAGRSRRKSGRATSDTVVLDCSVAMAWYFADEADEYADAVARSLSMRRAIVPVLWPLEIANTLVMGERRGRSTESQAAAFVRFLQGLRIIVDAAGTLAAWTETLAIARRHGLSAYDAAYLELAIRTASPLATRDKPLESAAKAAGVVLFARG